MTAPKPRLRDVEARAAAATEEVERLADPRGVNDEHWRGDHLDGIRRGMAARTDVPALTAAIRAVLDPSCIEDAEWLGDMRSQDPGEFGADPGNPAYMAYIERVLNAGYPGGFRWGPVIMAIILDRHVRETERHIAISAHIDLDES